MKKFYFITLILLIVVFFGYIYSQEKKGKDIICKPKIITTNYDSLAPLLVYNGWENLTNKEKINKICDWKSFLKKTKVNNGPMPKGGLIKNEITAIKIAEIYFYGLYGDTVYFEVPLVAVKLKDSIWHISGTLPPGWMGGTMFMDINAQNGKVLSIGHSK